MKNLITVSVVLLLLALAPMPYGYYQFLRLIAFITAGSLALVSYQKRESLDAFAVLFGLFALLYNPLFRIHLTREIWAPINILTAVAFLVLGRRIA